MSFSLQTTVGTAAPVALAGMHADSGIKDTISRKLLGTVLPGRYVCGDHNTCAPPDAAADVTGHGLGIVQLDSSGIPDDDGYADGTCLSVGRMGRFWGELLSGAAPTDGAAVYVYRGATVADRGLFTQDSGAGSVTRVEGAKFTGRTATGIAEIQFDGIGVPGDGVSVVASELAAVANGQGASLVGVEDAGAFTTAADVEAALAEIYQHLLSVQHVAHVNVTGGILAAGTPLAAWADNAGASAPGVTLVDSESVGVRWNNFATQTAVWYRAPFPQLVNGAADVVMHILASKIGATLGDATTFTVTAFIQAPGALHDADANFGGASSAMTGNAATKTVAELTLTLALADIPEPPFSISFSIKPTDGTLGTDDVVVHDIWFEFKPKILTA